MGEIGLGIGIQDVADGFHDDVGETHVQHARRAANFNLKRGADDALTRCGDVGETGLHAKAHRNELQRADAAPRIAVFVCYHADKPLDGAQLGY